MLLFRTTGDNVLTPSSKVGLHAYFNIEKDQQLQISPGNVSQSDLRFRDGLRRLKRTYLVHILLIPDVESGS